MTVEFRSGWFQVLAATSQLAHPAVPQHRQIIDRVCAGDDTPRSKRRLHYVHRIEQRRAISATR
jgi:hypothetical protein